MQTQSFSDRVSFDSVVRSDRGAAARWACEASRPHSGLLRGDARRFCRGELHTAPGARRHCAGESRTDLRGLRHVPRARDCGRFYGHFRRHWPCGSTAWDSHSRREQPTQAADAAVRATPRVDWRELRHWHIPESRLPPGTVVRFRPASLWEEHPLGHCPAIGTALAIQMVLIVALLVERRWRHRAMGDLQERGPRTRCLSRCGRWHLVWDVERDRIWATAVLGRPQDFPVLDPAALPTTSRRPYPRTGRASGSRSTRRWRRGGRLISRVPRTSGRWCHALDRGVGSSGLERTGAAFASSAFRSRYHDPKDRGAASRAGPPGDRSPSSCRNGRAAVGVDHPRTQSTARRHPRQRASRAAARWSRTNRCRGIYARSSWTLRRRTNGRRTRLAVFVPLRDGHNAR